MDRPKLEVADIFRRYGEAYRQQHGASLSTAQRRVMTAIEVCRTAALGGHLERCDCCGYERPCYDSCGDRHCPKCQSLARAAWVEKRISEVLPTHYFHVVFSVPEQIASIAYQNKKVVYGILFRATAETLSTIAADPKHLGRRDWLLRCPPQLGVELAPSPALALRRRRRRDLARRDPMDLLPPGILLARPGPLTFVPAPVFGISDQGLRRREAGVLLLLAAA